MKKFKTIFSVFLMLLLVLSLAACGSDDNDSTAADSGSTPAASDGASKEPVKLKIYTQYSGGDAALSLDYAMAEMKKIMPEVELKIDVEAQDDNQKIKALAAAGNLPDIFKVTPDLLELFKKDGNLAQLDKYIDEYNIEEKLVPSAAALLRDNEGHVWTMINVGPWASSIFYNKEIFQQNGITPPGNIDEMLAAIKVLKSKDIIPLAIHSKEKWPAVQLFDMIVTREEPMGVQKIDFKKGSITEEVYKKAAQKVIDLVKAGLISKDAFNTNYDQANALFDTGKAAMMINGAWGMSDYGAADKLGDKADLLYYPFADAGKEEQCKWTMSGGGFNQGFSVSAKSKQLDIASRYTVQMGLKFAEGRVIKVADPNPIMKNPPAPEKGYNTIQKRYVADSANFQTMTCFPWGITNTTFKTAIEDNCQSLLTGDMTVDEFISNIDNALK